jgi:hypothetical protein
MMHQSATAASDSKGLARFDVFHTFMKMMVHWAGLVVPAALQLAVASPAWADDPIAAGSAASSAAGTQAQAAADSAAGSLITLTNAAPDDPVITVLFYFAITVLSVVTLGVRRPNVVSAPRPLIGVSMAAKQQRECEHA